MELLFFIRYVERFGDLLFPAVFAPVVLSCFSPLLVRTKQVPVYCMSQVRSFMVKYRSSVKSIFNHHLSILEMAAHQ